MRLNSPGVLGIHIRLRHLDPHVVGADALGVDDKIVVLMPLVEGLYPLLLSQLQFILHPPEVRGVQGDDMDEPVPVFGVHDLAVEERDLVPDPWPSMAAWVTHFVVAGAATGRGAVMFGRLSPVGIW